MKKEKIHYNGLILRRYYLVLSEIKNRVITSISSQLNVASRGPDLIIVVNIILVSFSLPYLIYYSVIGGYFSAIALGILTFVCCPVIYLLTIKNKLDTARLLLPACLCLFGLFGTSLGNRHGVEVELYFVSVAVMVFVIFDLKKKYLIMTCLFFPFITWLAMQVVPYTIIPNNLLTPLEHLKTLDVINIWGSYLSSMIFFAMFYLSSNHYEKATLHQSKMAALGEVASGIAHEINNPLNVMSLRLGLIEDSLKENPINVKKIEESVKSIEKTILRVTSIVSGLRTFSRAGENDDFQQTNVLQLIRETIVICSDKLNEKEIAITYECPQNVDINCRSTQISQVLINLISNSIDAIERLENRWIKIDCRSNEKYLVLRVTDSGSGIPSEIIQRMMEPFFTTKPVGKGTGLGLSLSKSIIFQHNGQIEVDQKSKNTSFVITLPLPTKQQKSA